MSNTAGTLLWELRQSYKEAMEEESPEARDDFVDACYQAVPHVISEMDRMYNMLTTTNDIYTQNTGNRKTFSFRAECSYDVDALRHNLFHAGYVFLLDMKPDFLVVENGKLEAIPDVVATLLIDMEIGQLRSFMYLQEDAHVMAQTLRECPLEQNSLERDRSM